MREVLVTGATGRVGGRVAAILRDDYGLKPRVLVRDREKAPADFSTFVGDFEDSRSLGAAVEGVDAILLVSNVDPRQRELQGNLARAAAAGRPLIVKVSGLGTALDSYVDSGRWHAETEEAIKALGLPYTFLRPYFFMQNLGFQVAAARRDGVIRGAVGDSRIAMVDLGDIAAVAARLLAGQVDLAGQALALTGDRAFSYTEVADLLGKVLGRTVAYQRQTLDEARAALEKSGQPEWHIEILLQFNRAFADGWAAEPNRVVETVLGRPARTLESYLEEVGAEQDDARGRNPFPS